MIKFMTIHLNLFKTKLILYDIGLQHLNIIRY